MNIVSATQVLARHGMNTPTLNVLVSDASNYLVLLLQPQGQLEATQTGIRNRDRTEAIAQFGKFLERAIALQADLVMTPEYSTPWEVLLEAVEATNGGIAPGKLWALGCESIRYDELKTIREEIADRATVIFEEMESDDNLFVDPLAYVFRTTETAGGESSKPVVLVQFKTHAMVDRHEFEKNRLQLGQRVYQFGNHGAGISLVSLICSDAFAFTDDIAKQVYDRALILHIQLNPEPRHEKFLDCRAKLLGLSGDSTEIICLNWAREAEIWIDGEHKQLGEYARSAWYGKMQEFDSDDLTLSQNHRRGLYYANLKNHRAHTLFLNFSPAVYELIATKVVRLAVPGPVGLRRGPQLSSVLDWDRTNNTWAARATSDDGFLAMVDRCGCAEDQVRAVFDICPLACERLLALGAGNADVSLDWFKPGQLDSFKLDRSELIRRITFCQDSHPDANGFRLRRLRRCAHLLTILQTPQCLPASLKAGSNGFILEWVNNAPHQNLRCAGGDRATVMYVGEDSDDATIERTYKAARERIRRSLDEEAGDRAKQRVVLWHRDTNGSLQRRWDPPVIDRQQDESEYDIGRMQ